MRMRSCCALMMTMTMTTVMLTTTTMCRVRALVADFASTSNEHLFFFLRVVLSTFLRDVLSSSVAATTALFYFFSLLRPQRSRSFSGR